MSTRATGRLVDENGTLWRQPQLTVEVHDESTLFGIDPRSVQATNGVFVLGYPADVNDLGQEFGPRRLSVRVKDRVGRLLHEQELADVASDTLALGDITIKRAEVLGFLVTLGTGEPAFVTRGNEVTLLIDNIDAWGHINASFKAAERSIEFTQLNFFTPTFAANAQNESPILVFRFGPPPLTTTALRRVSTQDDRPEAVLREKAEQDSVSVRILLDHLRIPLLTFLVALFRDPTQADEVAEYFRRAGATSVKTYPFLPAFYRRMHLKVAFVDGMEAISIASPFRPGYLDDAGHAIEDPRRGGAADTAFPLHDVSLAVKGPAVADAYDAFRLHWNAALPEEDAEEKVQSIERADERPGGPDTIAALQVVRTLDDELFDERRQGELGILEGYLRAFGQAEKYIYCETQYLTNPAIADALVKAVSDRPALRVIIILNINPDIATYPRMQQKLINELFNRLPQGRPPQVGVFTRWTFEPANPPRRPRIAPIWLHSKVAIVDDVWATVGSANLDGASLDRTDLWAWLEVVDRRHSELNFNLLNAVDGQPSTDLVAQLRRRLWSEHLGVPLDDARLALGTGAGAFDLWSVQSAAALQALQQPSTAPASSSYVLPYPVGAPLTCFCCASHENPREHLDLLHVPRTIDAVKSVRGFRYRTGDWDPNTPVQIDG